MEGNQEQLSSDPLDMEIGYAADAGVLSLLFPALPADYFERHPDITLEKEGILTPDVVPYVKRRDLNNDGEHSEDNRPKHAWEIGIKIGF